MKQKEKERQLCYCKQNCRSNSLLMGINSEKNVNLVGSKIILLLDAPIFVSLTLIILYHID